MSAHSNELIDDLALDTDLFKHPKLRSLAQLSLPKVASQNFVSTHTRYNFRAAVVPSLQMRPRIEYKRIDEQIIEHQNREPSDQDTQIPATLIHNGLGNRPLIRTHGVFLLHNILLAIELPEFTSSKIIHPAKNRFVLSPRLLTNQSTASALQSMVDNSAFHSHLKDSTHSDLNKFWLEPLIHCHQSWKKISSFANSRSDLSKDFEGRSTLEHIYQWSIVSQYVPSITIPAMGKKRSVESETICEDSELLWQLTKLTLFSTLPLAIMISEPESTFDQIYSENLGDLLWLDAIAELPSAQSCIANIHIKYRTEISVLDSHLLTAGWLGKIVTDCKLLSNTPLCLYLAQESAAFTQRSALGPLGSFFLQQFVSCHTDAKAGRQPDLAADIMDLVFAFESR